MKDLSNENIVHVRKGNIEYIQYRELLKYEDRLKHCFTLRTHDIDFRSGLNDRSYGVLCDALDIDVHQLVKPVQTHTDVVEVVHSLSETFENVDGLITNQKEIALSLSFADCTAIFLYDPVKNVIGDIHSGWKGTAARIGQKAVNKMIQEYGCNPQDVICAIGPCIGKCHFEVDEDVMEIFTNNFEDTHRLEDIIEKGAINEGKQKYYIDTTLINRIMLQEVDIRPENIVESGLCTVCNAEYLHSYRVDKQLSGRNTAVMCLR